MRESSGLVGAGLALALMGSLALSGCSTDDQPPVETGAVDRHTVVERVEAPAAALAAASAAISSPATGTISRVAVHDGEQVRHGDILFVVNSPQTQRQLQQARQAASAAPAAPTLPQVGGAATTEQAAAAADRAFTQARDAAQQIRDRDVRQQALQQIAAAEAQVQAARAQAQSTVDQINASVAALQESLAAFTQAQTAQAQVALQAAEKAVKALTVRAPIDGHVVFGASSTSAGGDDVSSLTGGLPPGLAGQAQSLLGGSGGGTGGSSNGIVSAGSPVSDGDAILTVTDTSQLTVRAEIDETDVLLVRRGVVADIEFDAVPGARYRGVVQNVDLSPTTSARGGVSYVARLSLGGGTNVDGTPAPRPRPGMSAVASLRVLTSKGAIAVPVAAVFRDGDRDAVWLVDGETPTERIVTLGAQGEDYLEVVDGLDVGDTIVVRGADQVSAGEPLP